MRLYRGWKVEILPWIENGYLLIPWQTNKNDVYTLSFSWVTVFSGAIDLKHHQRTPLISWTILSYWYGTQNPNIIPYFNTKYLQETELVPTYRANVSQSSSMVTNLVSTYTPLQRWNFEYSQDTMSSAGYASPIGLLPLHDVLYFVSTGANIYPSVIRNAYSAWRYGIHYRDETTNRPLRFSSYPTLVIWNGGAMTDRWGSSANNYIPTATGWAAPQWDGSHHPSIWYVAYLLTGKFYFMEEVQFASTANYINITDTYRGWSNGVFDENRLQTRNAGWSMRTLAQALTVTPDDDSVLRNEFTNSMKANIDHFYNRYIAQPNNPFWLLANVDYGGQSFFRASLFMNDFCVGAFGYALSLNLPIPSVSATKLHDFFFWHAQSAVGRLGWSGSFWYINAVPYTMAYSPSKTVDFVGGTGPWYSSWEQMYDVTFNTLYVWRSWIGSTEWFLAWESPPGAWAAWSFWWNLQPAIAYAVRQGVPWASAWYQRMINASNWQNLAQEFNSQTAVWGVAPAFFPAQNISLTGPSNGSVGNPSWVFRIQIDGTLTQSITITPTVGGGWGIFSPSSITLSTNDTGATFTYIAATPGTKNISLTNSFGLTDPQPLSYTANISTNPQWMNGKSVHEWFSISGTTHAGSPAAPNEDIRDNFANSTRRLAYSNITIKDNEVFLAAVGGHGDYGGNEVTSIDLSSNNPTWQLRSASSTGIVVDVPYYPDGKPTSRHTYWTNLWSSTRNRIMLHRTRFSYGFAVSFPDSNGFDPVQNKWDPDNTWSDGYSAVTSDSRDNAWALLDVGGGQLYRWEAITDTWTKTWDFRPLRFPNGPMVQDTRRDQLFTLAWWDGWGVGTSISAILFNSGWTTATPITFNSGSALSQFMTDKPAYATMIYDPDNDRYVFFDGMQRKLYEIIPNASTTWDIRIINTIWNLPPISSYSFSRMGYIASLKGIVVMPSGTQNLYFMKLVP